MECLSKRQGEWENWDKGASGDMQGLQEGAYAVRTIASRIIATTNVCSLGLRDYGPKQKHRASASCTLLLLYFPLARWTVQAITCSTKVDEALGGNEICPQPLEDGRQMIRSLVLKQGASASCSSPLLYLPLARRRIQAIMCSTELDDALNFVHSPWRGVGQMILSLNLKQ